MKQYHALYISDSIREKRLQILKKIKYNKFQRDKFLIVLTKNEKNHLEFFDAMMLLQKTIVKEDLFLVGLADGYSGALELVQKITEEVYAETGGVDIRGYLLKKQQEFEESNV